jgi:hypothetical protein
MTEDTATAEVEKYVELPGHVRVFLEKMTEEDVEVLKQGIRWLRNTLIMIQVLKWLIGGAIIIFTTAAALGDSFLKMRGWK